MGPPQDKIKLCILLQIKKITTFVCSWNSFVLWLFFDVDMPSSIRHDYVVDQCPQCFYHLMEYSKFENPI